VSEPQLLHLLQLVSPALPVGAYAYSQGLEYAVELGHIQDRAQAQQWIGGIMGHSMAGLDLPLLNRLYRAWLDDDLTAVVHWNQFAQAARESAEFELEDVQMGRALMRLLSDLELPAALAWPVKTPVSFVTAFALAGVHWQIELATVRRGFCWSWLENQVAAATKLVPLGQTDGQRLLLALMGRVEQCCEMSDSVADHALASGLPGLAIISAQHECQYSRLFRS